MLIRRVLTCKATTKFIYPFSTDAKSLKIGVPKEIFPN